ncbi:MAG: UDP-N-acetylmuramoyl-L-alanine--D-glutamate ligase [Rectinemataceae bacterium]
MPSTIQRREDLAGMKVTVMGLGLHGGGLASAKFLADAGADVTVTDLRDEKTLAPSIAAMEGRKVRYVLGMHEMSDFSGADMVIKNPAVKADSPYLGVSKCVETDISIFLRFSRSPLVAVTGSKGKSSTASAIHHGFIASGVHALLGGNITVSPLGFLDETAADRPVVLELSSWQLADMRGKGILKPRIAILTAIMPDHMNYYGSMETYVADKRLIYADQDANDFTLCNLDQDWGRSFAAETRGTVAGYCDADHGSAGAWFNPDDPPGLARGYCRLPGAEAWSPGEEIVPAELAVQGPHMRRNLLAASLALRLMGVDASAVRAAAASFPGVEHRLEFFAESDGIRWYNDSAATIPQATAAALESFTTPVVLVTGGTDKNIDFSPVREAYRKARRLILLSGSGTDKLMMLLRENGIAFEGPYGDLDTAVDRAAAAAEKGDSVVLSPGCASFGMFLHEFDRGLRWKEAVRRKLSPA